MVRRHKPKAQAHGHAGLRLVTGGEGGVLTRLDETWKGESRHGQMPGVHGPNGVLTNEQESTVLDPLPIGGDHGHRTVYSQVPVEQLQ